MEATIKKWGNSYGLRLTKRDLHRLGLHEGDRVDFILQRRGPIDISGVPVLHGSETFEDVRKAYYESL